MWGILIGTILILAGCAGVFITDIEQIASAAVAFGAVLLVWGVLQLLRPQEDEIIPESEDPAPREHTPAPQEPATQAAAAPVTAAPAEPAPQPQSDPMPPSEAPAPAATSEEKHVHIATAPQEVPTPFLRGLRYLHTMDRLNGHKKAASCFIEGYEQGDLNAGYMLCHCYSKGKGVPVKPAFVVQLAEYLVKRRYYPAYWHLAVAHREGWGVPMNLALSAEYSKKFEEMCAEPVEGVEESMRYDALLNHELHKEEPDLRLLEHLARKNYEVSKLPTRYSLLALALLRDAACSTRARAELQYLLDEGCRADDMVCYHIKGLLLCHGGCTICPKDEKRGREYLRLAAERLGSPAALLSYLHHTQDEAQARLVRELFWSACRWGISGVQGSDELHCHLSVIAHGLAPVSRLRSGDTKPYLLIENKSEHTLHSAVARIVCIDKKIDVSIKLAPLAPEESVIIRLEDHQLELGKRLYAEVHKDGRFSRMYLHQTNLLEDFAARLS